MADLGIGATSLALELCKASCKYIEGVRSAKEKSFQIRENVNKLEENLGRIRHTIEAIDPGPHQQAALQSIDAFSTAFDAILEKLGAGGSLRASDGKQRLRILKERLRWPFEQSDVRLLEERLKSMEEHLKLTMAALQLENEANTKSEVVETKREVIKLSQRSEANDQVLTQSIEIFRQDSLSQISTQSQLISSVAGASKQRMDELHADIRSVKKATVPITTSLDTVMDHQLEMHERMERLEEHLKKLSQSHLTTAMINKDISDLHDVGQYIKQQRRTATRKAAAKKQCTCTSQSKTTVAYRQRPVTITKSQNRDHHPDCRYGKFEEAVVTLQVHFTVCSTLLGRKVHLGLALLRGAGSASINPLLRYDRVVTESSPAFRLIKSFKFKLNRQMGGEAWKTPAMQMERLFVLRKASPYDRLPNGMTLLHYFCSKMQKWILKDAEFLMPNYYAMGRQMLEFVQAQGMESQKDESGLSCVDYMVGGVHSDLVQYFTDEGGISITVAYHIGRMRNWEKYGIHPVPESQVSFDCSDSLRAILLQSEEGLLKLFERGEVSSNIQEHDISLYETATRTGWRRGCEIMLQNGLAITGKDVVESNTLLIWAILAGRAHMVQFWLEVRETLSDELEIQCVGSIEDTLSSSCGYDKAFTKECAEYCIASLVKQRQELSSLAREHSIQVPSDRLIDAQSFSIIRQLERYGVNVKPSLRPTRRSVYHVPFLPKWETPVLNDLYEAGFRDIAADDFSAPYSFAVSPLFFISIINYGLQYGPWTADVPPWFLARGASLTETWPGSDITLAHCMAYKIGIRCSETYHSEEAVSYNYPLGQNKDTCSCPCSASGCLPITAFCKALATPSTLRYMDVTDKHIEREWRAVRRSWRDRVWKLTALVDPATLHLKNRWLISETIRLIVFNELGIRHTCCNIALIMSDEEPDYDIRPSPRYRDVEELESIQEEDSHLVEILEELVNTFETCWDDGDHWMEGIGAFVESHMIPAMDIVLQRLKDEDEEKFGESREHLGISMRGGGDEESDDGSSCTASFDSEDEFDESELES